MLASHLLSRSLVYAGKPHLSGAFRQRMPFVTAVRPWSSCTKSCAVHASWGACATRRHRGVSVRAGTSARSVGCRLVAAMVCATKLRDVHASAKKKGAEEGGVGGGEGKKKQADRTRGATIGADDEDDDEEGDFDEEGGEFFDDDDEGIAIGESDIDADEDFFTAGTEWGELALSSLRTVMEDEEFGGVLDIFSLKVSEPRRRIYISIDALDNKFGSPTLDQLSMVSRKLNAILEEKGFPDDVSLEVASPGAERKIRLPGDLERFKDITMKVTYATSAEGDEAAQGQTTKVMTMTDLDEEKGTTTWKLADVSENRPQAKKGQGMNKKQREWRVNLAFNDIIKANLYIDITLAD